MSGSPENHATAPSIAVVANREKLRGRSEKRLRAALDDAGHGDAPWRWVEKGSAAKKATKKAMSAGADVVVACGGDGTIRAAAEGLVGTKCALAVVPAGTANLFAGALELPSDPAAIVKLIDAGERRTIDTGTCNGLTFAVMAGTGFDAGMIDAADNAKEQLGTLAYVRAGLHQARTREPFQARVTVDEELFFEGPATCVLVGNVGTLKGGVQAFPDASVTDGVLDLAVLTAAGMREWASVMVAALRQRQNVAAHTQMGKGRQIVVELDGKHRFQLDGGMKGRTKRLELVVRPQSLVLCAPSNVA